MYRVLRNHEEIFPENFLRMLDSMEEDNWLYNYREDWGIKFSIQNVLSKAKYLHKNTPVFDVFLQNKAQLKVHFDAFFPDILVEAQTINETFNH